MFLSLRSYFLELYLFFFRCNQKLARLGKTHKEIRAMKEEIAGKLSTQTRMKKQLQQIESLRARISYFRDIYARNSRLLDTGSYFVPSDNCSRNSISLLDMTK